jgi:NAD(P)-dependent dehydrogenase (short-subunit alcohol dehydrogenase family)
MGAHGKTTPVEIRIQVTGGVTVNTVSPGFTETAMLPDSFRETGTQMSPFKRVGMPKDIADVVAFVVSDEARSPGRISMPAAAR